MSDGIHFSLENLPERYRVQVAQQLAGNKGGVNTRPTFSKAVEMRSRPLKSEGRKKRRVCAPIRMSKKGNEPNHTEAQFNRDLLLGEGKYEALTLHLPGGSNYTADFLWQKEGEIYLIETKGSYHLPTHGRSVLAFKTACAEFPMFTFLFAELGKDGKTWNIGFYKDGREINSVRGTAAELHSM